VSVSVGEVVVGGGEEVVGVVMRLVLMGRVVVGVAYPHPATSTAHAGQPWCMQVGRECVFVYVCYVFVCICVCTRVGVRVVGILQ